MQQILQLQQANANQMQAFQAQMQAQAAQMQAFQAQMLLLIRTEVRHIIVSCRACLISLKSLHACAWR